MSNCRKCGSDNTQRVAMAFQSGTTTGRTTGVGFAPGAGMIIGGTRTDTQTELARRLSPPVPPGYPSGNVVAALFGGFFVGAIFMAGVKFPILGGLLFTAWFGAGVTLAVLAHKGHVVRMTTYQQQWAIWNKRWICNRCGEIWLP